MECISHKNKRCGIRKVVNDNVMAMYQDRWWLHCGEHRTVYELGSLGCTPQTNVTLGVS